MWLLAFGKMGHVHHHAVFQVLPLRGVLADIIHVAYVPSVNSKNTTASSEGSRSAQGKRSLFFCP